MADRLTLFEVGPRDGLQNEPRLIATADKIRLVDALSACGFTRIEAAAFVSPKWVPQMADAAGVMAGIARRPGVSYSALVPNMTGLQSALAARVNEVAVFAAASEGFSRRNINATIDESLDRFAPVAQAAAKAGVLLRGYVSCVCDCPYDGPTPPDRVADVAARLVALGCHEVSLGDTTGHGTPDTVGAMLDAVLDRIAPDRLAGHFHDTGGRALDNIRLSIKRGLRVFDASVGGLGGCPYAPGASGNVATGAVLDLALAEGFETDIDAERLEQVADFARGLRGAA